VGNPVILFALIAVAFLLLGLWIGSRKGRSAAQKQLDQALASERLLAETREAGLREQLEAARADVAALRSKAEELAAVRQQLLDEEAKYAQMKADLATAFTGAAVDALRSNTESFLDLAKQKLGGQAREAEQTLEAKELAIKTMLDPLKETLGRLDSQTEME
jgi:DNA recombination protein RmuC